MISFFIEISDMNGDPNGDGDDGLLGQFFNWVKSPLPQASNPVIMAVWVGGLWRESEPGLEILYIWATRLQAKKSLGAKNPRRGKKKRKGVTKKRRKK